MKKILTDCDGVLLSWEPAFHKWMKARGHDKVVTDVYEMDVTYGLETVDKVNLVSEFNASAWMGFLEPYKDAVQGVQELWIRGYKFDVITSMSSDAYAQQLRQDNLRRHFGNRFMDRFTSLDCGADKDEILKEYEGTGHWWIEDHPKNCDAGLSVGLRPILIDHPHNREYNNPKVIRAKDWNEVVSIILEDAKNEVA